MTSFREAVRGRGLVALLILLLISSATLSAQAPNAAAVAGTSQILFAWGASQFETAATPSIIPTNTGQWVPVLTTLFDASSAPNKALVIETSAVTAILTADYRAQSTGTLMLTWGGLQARVLVDCAKPACDPTSDNVPAANLADPGVVVLDELAHFLLADTITDIALAADLAAGARSFNFYKINLKRVPKNDHLVQFQVKFNAGGMNATGMPPSTTGATPQLFSDATQINGAIVAIAKRTMIVQSVRVDLDENGK